MQRLPSMIKHSISETVFKWVIIVAHPWENVIEFLSIERAFLTAKLKSHQRTFPCSGFPKTLPIPDQLCLVVREHWQLCPQMAHLQPRKLFWESYQLSARKENGATTTTCWRLFFWQWPQNSGHSHSLRPLVMLWVGFHLKPLGQKGAYRDPRPEPVLSFWHFPTSVKQGELSKSWENKLHYKVRHRHHRKHQDQATTAS